MFMLVPRQLVAVWAGVLFCSSGPRSRSVEVPRLGLGLEPQLPAFTTGCLTHCARPGIEPATFWFVARCAIQLRQRGIWWPKAESNCRHRDFQSPALPTELSSHMAESERFELSMRCRTTVFKTARLPIITTLQLAETERIELSLDLRPLTV